eukprot:8792011-Lingulodinium_polyedra.AAC.1
MPVQQLSIGGRQCFSVKPPSVGDTFLLTVFQLANWELLEVQWASPMHVGNLDHAAPCGLVALAKGGPSPALSMGARKAFWALPESYLDDLAKLLKVSPYVGSLLAKLAHLIHNILGGLPGEELLAIL